MNKIFGILLFIGFYLGNSSSGFAQHFLDMKYSQTFQNKRLDDVLAVIEEDFDLIFSYPSDLIPTEKIINKTFHKVPLRMVLRDVLGAGFRFVERGSYIIIQADRPARVSKKEVTIKGQLVDAETGKKISNATIYDVNSLTTVQTDSNGNYELKFGSKTKYAEVAVARENYKDTVIRIYQEDLNALNINLKPADSYFDSDISMTDSMPIVQRLVSKDAFFTMSNVHLEKIRPAQISFLPFAGTNARMSGKITNYFSLNILAGYSYSTTGIEVGGLCNIDRRSVTGIQVAGLTNIAGGEVRGIQVGGMSNVNLYRTYGLQVAGIFNHSKMQVYGMQLSGISNYGWSVKGNQISGIMNTAGYVSGIQLAGMINVGNVDGIQCSGLINFGYRKVQGIQFSGLINYAGKVNGIQFASLLNIAGREMNGLQISSLLNVCGKLNGLQLGVINLCDTVESGVNVGLFNFVRKGLHTLQIHTTENMPFNLSFKTGTDRFYNILSAGLRKDSIWMFGYGIGSMHRYKSGIFTGTEFQFNSVQKSDNDPLSLNFLSQITPFLGYKIWKHANVSFGPVLNIYYRYSLHHNNVIDDYNILSNAFYKSNGTTDSLEMSLGYKVAFFF
ncbi:MAG: hypothetical protein GC181_08810 [Bacteroidetes bacterium]|nr:hypothetical protein [Bacteroidota bacterium]